MPETFSPEDAKALDDYARTLEPKVRAAFLQAIKQLREDTPQSVWDYVTRTKDYRPLLDLFNAQQFQLAVQQAMIQSAAASQLPIAVNWNVLNPEVVQYLQQQSLKLVTGLKQETAAGIQRALITGVKQGVNPVDTARDLRTLVGLTDKQVQSVANYRGLLTGGKAGQPLSEAMRRLTRDARHDRTLRRYIDTKTPLPQASVDQQVSRFEQRLLNQRAETIARTNTMDALFQGNHARWTQAIHEGKVDPRKLRRFWYTAEDERVCPICMVIPFLNEEGVAFDQPFFTPVGPLMGPTAHPNCRCIVFVRILYAAVTKFELRKMAQMYSGFQRAA